MKVINIKGYAIVLDKICSYRLRQESFLTYIGLEINMVSDDTLTIRCEDLVEAEQAIAALNKHFEVADLC